MLTSAITLLSSVLTYSLLLVTLLWCWFQWTHRDVLRVARKLPVVLQTWPVLGHIPFLIGSRERLARNLLKVTLAAIAKGHKAYSLWVGPIPLITLTDMADIQVVLNSSNCSDKADEYVLFDSGQGTLKCSLLTSPGHIWRITRKHMNPMFHPRNVQHMMPVFNENSRALVSCLSEHVGHGNVNVMSHTMDVSLKTVCNLLFGPEVDIDMNSSEFKGLMTVVEMIPEFFIQRLMFPWLRIRPVFQFIYKNDLQQLNIHWNNFTDKRLEKVKELSKSRKMKDILSSEINSDEETSFDIKTKDPLNIIDAFSVLQQNYPQFTEADMRDEMLSFYCTGTDTVGSATASCLLALAYYQDIQERLYQEISSAVGPEDDVTLEDLNRMPYLDQVFKETLRWFLIVPFVMRKANKDIALSTFTVPAGNSFSICLAAIHMDPTLYPEPYKFDPDRFAHENSSEKRFSFVPFSGGPRNCIAKTYATLLTKIMVVHVIRKYRLSTEMDIFNLRKRLIVTLVNADGYNISLHPRTTDVKN